MHSLLKPRQLGWFFPVAVSAVSQIYHEGSTGSGTDPGALYAGKLPYVMPVAMGLIGTPASCVSVGCGVVVYYLLQTVITNAPTINSMGAEEATAKLRLLIDGMLGNKAMLVMIAAFAITVIVVYLIRRMSVDHSWTIAMVCRRYDRSDDPAGGRSDVRYQSLHRQRTVRCRCYADHLQRS